MDDRDANSELRAACIRGQIDIVRQLVLEGIEVNNGAYTSRVGLGTGVIVSVDTDYNSIDPDYNPECPSPWPCP